MRAVPAARRVLAAAAIACCQGGEDALVRDGGGPVSDEPDPCSGRCSDKVDLLFVVDNSNTMAAEQVLLYRQFPLLVDALAALPGGFPDVHIGVTSTDLGTGRFHLPTCEEEEGDAGRLLAGRAGRSCPALPAPEPFIRVTNSGSRLDANVPDTSMPVLDDTGGFLECLRDGAPSSNGEIDICDVARSFECAAALGTGGCGFEQPLEAALQALSPPNTDPEGANAGFLREDSLLVVVFVTDEDDCSAAGVDLFDPNDASIGPLSSFRCFEHGVRCGDRCPFSTCAGPIPRRGGATLGDCRPLIEEELGDGERHWLHPVSRYEEFFRSMRPCGDLLVVAIAGPWASGDPVHTETDSEGNPDVAPSCWGETLDTQATPALRIRTLIDSLGDQGVFGADLGVSLCSPSYATVFETIGARLAGTLCGRMGNEDGDGRGETGDAPCRTDRECHERSRATPICNTALAPPRCRPQGGRDAPCRRDAECDFFDGGLLCIGDRCAPL